MSSFETSATVEEQGRVFIAGVPFAPGTKVQVTVSPQAAPADERSAGGGGDDDVQALAAARNRMRELFDSIKGFRNSPRIPREELYERGRVR